MTGSGKTGLCIDILEEAALKGIPALVIDPKGDITNLMLHFPNMSPQDFHVDMFGVAWLPYWQVKGGEELFELPGYKI